MRSIRISPLVLSISLSSGAALAAPASDVCSPARFNRVATLPNYLNDTDPSGATVSEIVAANASGSTLVYTDSLLEEVGFLDITDPSAPAPLGKLGVGGEPTSVAVLGENLALVAVNTRESFVDPSGHLALVDIASQTIVSELELGGQPDSVAISPSRRFAAVVIENERDEDVTVDGVEGGLPQAPTGFLAIVDLAGDDPTAWSVRRVDLTGLTSYAPGDAEPEFVDVNERDEAVVTLQENNHVIVVDLASGNIVNQFPAGEVALDGVDTEEDGIISLTSSLTVAREPDAVAWLPGRRGGLIATANEGDLFGGSRGFSIFDRRGDVVFDSGNSLERIAVRHGHYPESRSDAKGTEPESIEYGRFGNTDYLFVGSERGSFVAVYELTRPGQPEFVQLLPAPLGPEGVRAIPERGLLVVSGEEDDPTFGVRSSVMIYQLGSGAQTYPQIVSGDDAAGQPIPWSALSGMAAVPGRSRELYAVWDSYYAESRIFTIDASRSPARITTSLAIAGGSGNYDPEGIAVAPDGTLWIASEGDDAGRPNLLIQTDAAGHVLKEVGLPAEIEACRAATSSRRTLASGFEGVSVVASRDGYSLIVPQQRGWNYTTPECEPLDDDASDTNPAEPSATRLWTYDPTADAWTSVAYDLEPLPPNAGWVGLSEVTSVPGGYIILERDNLSGDFAQLKTLVHVKRGALADGRVTRDEKRSDDLLPHLLATHGWITDKPEGVAVTNDGTLFVVTDNDGVEDWSGETWFLRLGEWKTLFR
ncbi:MAG TPA: esterase-like activity of phytase family protein [Polyangiaceae bacterium]|nr:esterase-like activity of phytase family protein [Polyangiaceae bacterium]